MSQINFHQFWPQKFDNHQMVSIPIDRYSFISSIFKEVTTVWSRCSIVNEAIFMNIEHHTSQILKYPEEIHCAIYILFILKKIMYNFDATVKSFQNDYCMLQISWSVFIEIKAENRHSC